MGTPDYMPPEAAEGKNAGPPSDIYSFGVVLYEALSGRLPFLGKSAIAIIRQHIETPPPPILSLAPELKPQLAAIIHKCLAKKPEERYADCPALARALWEIVPEQVVLDIAEGRVPGTDDMPLQQTHFGFGLAAPGSAPQPAHTPATVPSAQPPPARTPVPRRASGQSDADATVTLQQSMPPTLLENPGTGATAYLPPEAIEEDEDAPDADDAPPKPNKPRARADDVDRRRGVASWIWGLAGFLSVLVLALIVVSVRRNSQGRRKPEFEGQPIVRKIGEGRESDVLMEFNASESDPQRWYFVVRRQQPDGSWKLLTVPYRDYVSQKTDTEFLFTEDARKKP
jgi:hypothetical protein